MTESELIAELQRRAARAQEQRAVVEDRYEALLDALQQMLSATTAQEQYDAVLRAAARAHSCEGGVLARWQEDAYAVLATSVPGAHHRRIDKPSLLRRLRQGCVVTFYDVAAAEVFDHPVPGATSGLFVPLAEPEHLLVLLDPRRGYFGERAAESARRLAVLVSQALRNAQELAQRSTLERRRSLGAMALVRASPDPMWVVDEALRLTAFNPEFAHVAGRLHAGLPTLEDPIEDWMPKVDASTYRRVLAGREEYLEWSGMPGGRVFDVCLRPLRDDDRVVGVHATAHDVTSQRAAARQLRRAKHVAEIASQAKTAFLASMSHELRTPLTAILGYGELLEEELCGPTLQDVQRILSSASHLLELIDDVLDMSSIEAGNLEPNVARFDLAALLCDIETTMHVVAAARGIAVSVFEGPCWALGDARRVRQILLNLTSNAAKFARSRIVVRVEHHAGHCMVRVLDDGPGVSADLYGRLFQPFAKGQTGAPGTGLGLALSRDLARNMGGDLVWEGVGLGGRGAHFALRLVAEPVTA